MTLTSSQYLIRPMAIADIARVSEIERESFPTMWPQTAYKRELQRNNLAAYLVVCEIPPDCAAGPADERPLSAGHDIEHLASSTSNRSRLADVGHWVQGLFGKRSTPDDLPRPTEQILGFVGLWFMVDEAHIVTIAVAEASRRRGLGEMLLIASIELAQRREQEVMTLECRVTNTAAQALYLKYGFRQVGVRKRYYSDNDEDALIMTTFPIQTAEYNAEFARLRAQHAARWGTPLIAQPDLEAGKTPPAGGCE
jgi:ribosomal-protein-alanine N-acetyltransferase